MGRQSVWLFLLTALWKQEGTAAVRGRKATKLCGCAARWQSVPAAVGSGGGGACNPTAWPKAASDPRMQAKVPGKSLEDGVGETSKHFAASCLFFTQSWSCMCAAGQVWKGLLRGRMNHAEEDRKSPVLVPCILRSMLLVILFLQGCIKRAFHPPKGTVLVCSLQSPKRAHLLQVTAVRSVQHLTRQHAKALHTTQGTPAMQCTT